MTALPPRSATLPAEARRIAREVAAPHAGAVDREARPPREAIAALRAAGMLGAAVPRALGGQGAPIRDVAAACFELGQACASAAMVFAMHQIQVACLVRHGPGNPWQETFLRRVAAEGLLLASGTTEGATGGDVGASDCAVAGRDGVVALEKQAPSDQVLLVAPREQLELAETAAWDTMGMRGTDSRTYALRARCAPEQVMPAPYATISAETMLPVSHIVWASLWLGIATDAAARARVALRGRARRTPGRTPAGAPRLAELALLLQGFRATLADAVQRYETALAEPDRLGSIHFGLAMNGLKLAASTMAVQATGLAMQSIGLAGYRNDTPTSVARHLRDAHSSILMVGNDRVAANNAALMTAWRGEDPLFP
jgi:acyl-CoA dehydrogenase